MHGFIFSTILSLTKEDRSLYFLKLLSCLPSSYLPIYLLHVCINVVNSYVTKIVVFDLFMKIVCGQKINMEYKALFTNFSN